jgi:hypothetical protein
VLVLVLRSASTSTGTGAGTRAGGGAGTITCTGTSCVGLRLAEEGPSRGREEDDDDEETNGAWGGRHAVLRSVPGGQYPHVFKREAMFQKTFVVIRNMYVTKGQKSSKAIVNNHQQTLPNIIKHHGTNIKHHGHGESAK